MRECTRCCTTIVFFHQINMTRFTDKEKEDFFFFLLVLEMLNIDLMKGNNSRVTAWTFTRFD